MKKLSAIILTTLIVVISVGNFGLFSLFLKQYKANLQAHIRNNTSQIVDVIHINPSELYADNKTITWEDGNKEIVYKGVLYDIVSIETIKGKVSIKAISDSKEQDYKTVYASMQEKNNTTSNSPLNLLKQFLSLNFIETKTINTHIMHHNEDVTNFDYYSCPLHKGYLTMETPPPNC